MSATEPVPLTDFQSFKNALAAEIKAENQQRLDKVQEALDKITDCTKQVRTGMYQFQGVVGLATVTLGTIGCCSPKHQEICLLGTVGVGIGCLAGAIYGLFF